MTDDELPPRLTRLTFHGPLSEARAVRLVGRLTRTRPATVLDLGCGWGELMLRILAAVPGATGTTDALHALRRLVNPGGRVLLGECCWEHPPTPAEIAAMWPGISTGNHYDSRGCMGLAYLTLIPLP